MATCICGADERAACRGTAASCGANAIGSEWKASIVFCAAKPPICASEIAVFACLFFSVAEAPRAGFGVL